jgi:L-2-hydroxyglutarate oxidase
MAPGKDRKIGGLAGETCDVVVVGGGIVGLATGLALAGRGSLRIGILEAEEAVARHQTGHNSGVIHAGLYYRPGSLKARNCAAGRERMYAFCREHGVAHERTGKLVVATGDAQRPMLDELARRGEANGLDGISRLDAAGLAEYEPHVRGVAGLHVPQTGIVDFGSVASVMAERFEAAGGVLWTGARVTAVCSDAGGHTVATTRGALKARYLVGCAGLWADRLARMCGLKPEVRIIPFRGEYYVLREASRSLVKGLIYPVPDPRFPFLGVHFTRTIHGGVEAGPNAVLAFQRAGYSWCDFSLRDTLGMAAFPGFWRMAARYWRTGAGEMYRSLNRGAFVRALAALVPAVGVEDVEPGGSGVRAQAVTRQGALCDDFIIEEAEGMMHVLNAPSPAATASLSIGDAIADRFGKRFGLG